MNNKSAILLIHCPDAQGIVAKITEFLNNNNGNIIELDQHVDHEEKIFYMRICWELEKFLIPQEKIADYFNTLIASQYKMDWALYFSGYKHKMALFVSKMSHCLYDILARYKANDLNVEIPFIISNHEDLKPVAEAFGVPFHYFPINDKNKFEQEQKELELLKQHSVNFVVLARYMQILSDKLIEAYPNRIINIHHSFLPAFPGAKPYHSAYKRGVKIIGATSHYVTADLDEGPIIGQDVTRIDHEDSIDDLVQKGKDLEKIVLSKAIKLHLQHRVLVYHNRTVVFD
jgi:formyltetrahydrofolate deformylase